MELNKEEIRKTGRDHYPAVAELFGEGSKNISDAKISAKVSGTDIEANLNQIVGFLEKTLSTSSDYLNDCGETLLVMVDEYDFKDGENAFNIDHASNGIESDQYY